MSDTVVLLFSPACIRAWARSAPVGSTCVYHAGALDADHLATPALAEAAELVGALAEADIIATTQDRARQIQVRLYAATMLHPNPRHPLVTGELRPVEWRALAAISARDERVSVTRAVARALVIAEAEAAALVASLRGHGYLATVPAERGQEATVLSQAARRMLA